MGRCLLEEVRLYLKTSLSIDMTLAPYFRLIASIFSFCVYILLDLFLSAPVLGHPFLKRTP